MDEQIKKMFEEMQKQITDIRNELIKFKRDYDDKIYNISDENIDFISSSKIRD
jgi:cob(I)alamin adenosyltransferase